MVADKELLRNAVGDNCLWWVHSSWGSTVCGKRVLANNATAAFPTHTLVMCGSCSAQ